MLLLPFDFLGYLRSSLGLQAPPALGPAWSCLSWDSSAHRGQAAPYNQESRAFCIPSAMVQSSHKIAVPLNLMFKKTHQTSKPSSNKHDKAWLLNIYQFGTSAQLLNKHSRQTFCPTEHQGTSSFHLPPWTPTLAFVNLFPGSFLCKLPC